MINNKHVQYKLLIIGDSGVGKTSIMQRYVENKFLAETKSTIGVEYRKKTIYDIQGVDVDLMIWDTAGQERFRSITPSYYKGALGAIIMYDITNLESFQNIERIWLDQVTTYGSKDIQIFIVGNKSDKQQEKAVNTNSAKTICEQKQYTFMETSAKENTNIEELFKQIANRKIFIINEKEIYEKQQMNVSLTRKSTLQMISTYNIKINEEKKEIKVQKCC